MRLRYWHLAAGTTALTFLLILLGVFTAATGTGMSCGAQWPTCGGGPLGLFPPNLASVPEWVHRFVAMVVGFAILGTAAQAWRGDHSKRVRYAATLALFTLPFQVAFGQQTIVNYGALIQVVHQGTAQIIFGSLLATALWARER
ncbi:MAG: COX15/CtaA family protein [Halobacteriaceae archaeon]